MKVQPLSLPQMIDTLHLSVSTHWFLVYARDLLELHFYDSLANIRSRLQKQIKGTPISYYKSMTMAIMTMVTQVF